MHQVTEIIQIQRVVKDGNADAVTTLYSLTEMNSDPAKELNSSMKELVEG
jgi:hypothetical protein